MPESSSKRSMAQTIREHVAGIAGFVLLLLGFSIPVFFFALMIFDITFSERNRDQVFLATDGQRYEVEDWRMCSEWPFYRIVAYPIQPDRPVWTIRNPEDAVLVDPSAVVTWEIDQRVVEGPDDAD